MSVTGHIIGNWNLSGDVGESGGTNVVPNPPEEATDSLEKVAIDDVVYSITGEQEQADWDQADPTAVDYIKNKPTIPAAQVNSDWDAESGVAEILNKPTLSAVATSGSYTDLTDTPTIPAAQVNSDWDAASGVAEILNKPTLSTVATSGDYDDLINKPTIPAAQVNSDWNAASGVAQILNKPTIPAAQVNSDWNAVSGVAEILNKPTIPAAQVNSDWDAASGVAQILNKPTLATVATSGEASDVSYDNSVSGMTATDVQDAVDELKSNLTDLPNNLTFGTPVQIPWTNNKYTCPSAGVVTGYVRKTENATAGYVSIRSSASNIYRVFSTLSGISGMYLNINFNVVKNEELTIAGSEILNRALYFIPYEIS